VAGAEKSVAAMIFMIGPHKHHVCQGRDAVRADGSRISCAE